MPAVVVVTRHSILGARRFDRVGDNLHDTSHIYHVSLAELPRISSERDFSHGGGTVIAVSFRV